MMPAPIGNTNSRRWPETHIAAFQELCRGAGSFSQIAADLSVAVQHRYTRDACIGKAYRLGIKKPSAPMGGPRRAPRDRSEAQAAQRREKRWKANPSLQERYERMQQQKETRAAVLRLGYSRTSPGYRKHLAKIPDMTKTELRAILALAWANTAAMGVEA